MKRIIQFAISSWKSSGCGLVAAGALYVHMFPNRFAHHPDLVALADFIVIGGLAGLGIVAKDSDKGSNLPHDDMPKKLQGPPPEVPQSDQH